MSKVKNKPIDENENSIKIFEQIWDERTRQDRIWGGPAHDDNHEFADWFGFINKRTEGVDTTSHARERLIQIAALAIAAIESIDRNLQ